MGRCVLSALALVLVLHAGAGAQPGAPASFRFVDAKLEKGKLFWTEVKVVPVNKQVEVTVNMNGMNVVQKRDVTVYESITIAVATDLKGVKVTDGAGKAIAADKLADLLKDAKPIVLVSGALSAEHRALFKDTTVFVELPPPAPPGEKKD